MTSSKFSPSLELVRASRYSNMRAYGVDYLKLLLDYENHRAHAQRLLVRI